MKAIGVGRFVRDPELRQLDRHDTCVCDFSLAVDERRRVNGETKKITHFFDFVIWDKAAEVISQYCRKGDMIYVVASPRQDKWQDKDGNNRSKIVFRVDDFRLLPNGKKNVSDEGTDNDNLNDDDESDVDF